MPHQLKFLLTLFQQMNYKDFLAVILLWSSSICTSNSQQQYNEADQKGYKCSDSTRSCNTYVIYRTRLGAQTMKNIATLFGSGDYLVAQASMIKPNSHIIKGQLLLIPTACACAGGNRSQANVSYSITHGDNYYYLSRVVFDGLTSSEAIQASNPTLIPTKLQVGTVIIVPIRCACASSVQNKEGINTLVTYPVWNQENLKEISHKFKVSEKLIRESNDLLSWNGSLIPHSTVLIPVKNNARIELGKKNSKNKLKVIAGTVTALACIVIAIIAVYVAKKRLKNRSKERRPSKKVSFFLRSDPTRSANISTSSTKRKVEARKSEQAPLPVTSQGQPNHMLLPSISGLMISEKPLHFSYEELRAATDGFCPARRIQGSVYSGILRGSRVAIKAMKGSMNVELKILCKVHHGNIVKLVGLCISGTENIYLVYEFAENGSLADWLWIRVSGTKNRGSSPDNIELSPKVLDWDRRMKIAQDIAKGLEYIHNYTNPSIVHKDIKCSNILLDTQFRAKLANFGMARPAGEEEKGDVLTNHVVGTQGYLAPEYARDGIVSSKVDVYAFGVVLLQLITGREAVLKHSADLKLGKGERFLGDAIRKAIAVPDPEGLLPWIDPALGLHFPFHAAMAIANLAISCLCDDHILRPSMAIVGYTLCNALG